MVLTLKTFIWIIRTKKKQTNKLEAAKIRTKKISEKIEESLKFKEKEQNLSNILQQKGSFKKTRGQFSKITDEIWDQNNNFH